MVGWVGDDQVAGGIEAEEVLEKADLSSADTVLLVVNATQLSKNSEDLSMFLRNSLSECRVKKYQKGQHVSVAVVLTACDSVNLRDDLGTPWQERFVGVEAEERSAAAEDYLCSKIEGLSEAAKNFRQGDIKFFAVSAWGEWGDRRRARPMYVEEPLIWLMKQVHRRSEESRRERSIRRLSSLGAVVSFMIASSVGVLFGPTLRQLQAGEGAVSSRDPFVKLGEALSLPLRHLPSLSSNPRHLEGLRLWALEAGADGDSGRAEEALRWLKEADQSG